MSAVFSPMGICPDRKAEEVTDMKKKKPGFFYPLITILVAIAVWEAVTRIFSIPSYILPGPVEVAAALGKDFSLILYHAASTLAEGAIGIAISIGISILIAIWMDHFPLAKKTVYPLLVISQTVPVMAIAPLLIIWFGFGIAPKIILVVVMCFFPITVNMTDGFSQVDRDCLNMFRVWKASEGQIYRHLKFPCALPYFFSGLRISVTWMLVSAILSEWLGGDRGIGVYMLRAKQTYALDKVFAAVIFVVLMSLVLIGILNLIRKKAIYWTGTV
jgi:ABC-type nitrate/sulfonate/bicarbonate transport system permease component